VQGFHTCLMLEGNLDGDINDDTTTFIVYEKIDCHATNIVYHGKSEEAAVKAFMENETKIDTKSK